MGNFMKNTYLGAVLAVILILSVSRVDSRPENDVQTVASKTELEGEEKIIGKVRTFNHMRNLIHKFDYSLGFLDTVVFDQFKKIKNLSPLEIPSIIDQQNDKAVTSFQRRFRMCYAILQASKAEDATAFKKEIKSLAKIEDDKKIAILAAQLFCLLSEFGHEDINDKVDWSNEHQLIDALKRWGIDDTDLLSTARAFHRLRTRILSKCKKMYIHTIDVEEEALTQFNDCASKDFVLEAVLMPDAHSGYVAPIGSVIKTKEAVVPAWVGYDIGCGMIAVKIADHITEQNLIREKAREIFDQVNKDIPMGVGRHNEDNDQVFLVEEMESALKTLNETTTKEYEELFLGVHNRSRPNLGSLGSGNHFIEISVNGDETWLVIHSGSRGVGHFTGVWFMKATAGSEQNYEATSAIKDMAMRDQYMNYQDYCLKFALLNRMSMALKVENVIRRLTGIVYDTNTNLWTNKNHNHCIKLGEDVFLHRKGATSSGRGERGVIPGNMKDGCYLVEGLGSDDFLHSSSHGAGRQMSRTVAKKKVTLDQFENAMEGIVAPINAKTIDESPFAYKNITGVMTMQRDSVKIVKHLKPIINWKGY